MFQRHSGPGWFPTFLPLALFIYYFYYKKTLQHKNKQDMWLHTLFFFYIFLVIDLTQAPFPVSKEALEHIANYHSFSYSLTPFTHVIMAQNILNILLFIPFTILLPLCFRSLKLRETLTLAFLFTLTIEITQLITSALRLNVRTFDIDDILTNFTGALIGVIIYKIVHKLSTKSSR